MAQQQLSAKRQQGEHIISSAVRHVTQLMLVGYLELQLQYTNYKNGLQQIAQKIGDVEQEAEEHKYVANPQMPFSSMAAALPSPFYALRKGFSGNAFLPC